VTDRERVFQVVNDNCVAAAALAPAPLVLQFVKAVLAIGPISIELANGLQIVVGIRHQDGVFPQLQWDGVGKVEVLLALCPLAGRRAFRRERVLERTAHDNDTTPTAPAGQLQRRLDGVIPAADICPVIR
jgi:hypothetical protein